MDQSEYIPDSQSSFGIVSEVLKKNFIKLTAIYLIGVVPFQVFLVYFFLELGYSGNADQKVFTLSIIAFILFCWLKIFQSIFTTNIYYMLKDDPMQVSFGLKEILYQICVQSSSLAAYTISFILIFTLQGCYNFYNYSLIVTTEKQKMKLSERLKFDGKNGCGLIENAGLSSYFLGVILFVFLNIVTLLFLMPHVLHTLFGIETIFLKSISGFFNLISFLVIFNLTFLVCDPFFKGVYALRYYYKIALPKGGDLQYRLNRIFKLAILVALIWIIPFPSEGKESTKENLQEVLSQKKYQWRDGKKLNLEETQNSYIGEMITKFLDWLFDRNLKDQSNENSQPSGTLFTGDLLTPVLKILLCVFLIILVIILYRNFKLNQKIKNDHLKVTLQNPIIKKPEVDKFDNYDEDEWANAARELVQQGDFRGAIRALYYQVLMSLGEKNLLLIQRYKTNSQYRLELKNRAHSLPEVNTNFIKVVLNFEEAWFSNKSISEEDFNKVYTLVYELKGRLHG